MRELEIYTMKKSLFFLLIAMALHLASCGESEPLYRIGVSQCSDDEWRRQMNEEINREALFHPEAKIEIRTSDDDNGMQIADIEYFIKNGFDLIIVSPREAKAITPAIKEAYDKGIPVIVFDRAIEGESYTSYMKLDNYGIGRAAARYAVQALPAGHRRIVELRGLDDSSPAIDRHSGFMSVADSVDDFTVLASVPAYWLQEPASAVMDSLLNVYPDIDAVYAHNDRMAIGAAQAARRHGRDDIMILGTDAAPSLGIKAVSDSIIDATFVYPTEGARVVRTAINILRGEHFERIDNVPSRYAVDASNADILLRQNELLSERTRQLEQLNERNVFFQTRQQWQQYVLLTLFVGAILLIVTVVMLIRFLNQRKKYNTILVEKNAQLEAEHERQEQLYAQLEEATRSKLVFFTNVSHDLRTPLALISEPVRQVSKADYLTPAHRSLMDMAMRNLRILNRLIEQILDFRRYQNGRLDVKMEEVMPCRLIGEWGESFRELSKRRNITFTMSRADADATSGSCPKTLAVDVEKFERIFFNLLSNAFKYTPDGGEISVECGFENEGSEFRLCVRDSGIGISEEDCEKIFDRFYQVDKVHHSGSGIGLSLTKAFVEIMGGSIAVKSGDGRGSEFTVILPVRHAEDEDLKAGSAEEAQGALPANHLEMLADLEQSAGETQKLDREKELVLVVDDSPDILMLLQEILGEEYNVMTAPDGASGLRLATRFVPGLIISDIMMPGMDGLEFCRKVKAEVSTSHIPIMMLTACKLEEERVRSYDSGADGFISKPFTSDLLLSRVRNLLLNRKRIYDLYADGTSEFVIRKRRSLPATNDADEVESEFYGSFIAEVGKRYTDSEVSIKDFADALGIGATQLTRKIKALTGLTPVEIIRNYRLRVARKQLLSTENSVSEIAYDVGFSSPQYFARCFREAFGMTPSDLRAKP